MDPGPESILVPLVIMLHPLCFRKIHDLSKCFIPFKKHNRVFYPFTKLFQDQEFYIHVEQRIIIQADQYAWFSNMFPGKSRNQFSELFSISDHLFFIV